MAAITCDLEFHDVDLGLKALFTFAYAKNCALEHETLTEEDRQTLADLDSLEVLENFKDLVLDLLNCKQDFRATDKSELAQRSEQFEVMLQKLESEVRGHIRVEQQLKLHLEVAQARVDEMEKLSEVKTAQVLRESLTVKEKELEELRGKSPDLRRHDRTSSHDTKKVPVKASMLDSKTMLRLESQCEQLKSQLRDKHSEMESMRKEYQLLTQEFAAYKARTRSKEEGKEEVLLGKRIEMASPYKEKSEPVYIRTVYQTYIDTGKGKRHMRTSSDRSWRPSSSSKRTRPVSSLKV